MEEEMSVQTPPKIGRASESIIVQIKLIGLGRLGRSKARMVPYSTRLIHIECYHALLSRN